MCTLIDQQDYPRLIAFVKDEMKKKFSVLSHDPSYSTQCFLCCKPYANMANRNRHVFNCKIMQEVELQYNMKTDYLRLLELEAKTKAPPLDVIEKEREIPTLYRY